MSFLFGFITGGIVVPFGLFIWAFWPEIIDGIKDKIT